MALVHAWRRERFLYAPSENAKSRANDAVPESSLPAPLCHCLALAVQLEEAVRTSVVCLMGLRFPSAVAALVVAVVVDPLNGVLRRWAWSHVGQERLKGRAPRFAHANATTAVVRVRLLPLVVAAVHDGAPNAVVRSFAHAMRGVARTYSALAKASATLGATTKDAMAHSIHAVTAHALRPEAFALRTSVGGY